jgi:hypothetical protein
MTIITTYFRQLFTSSSKLLTTAFVNSFIKKTTFLALTTKSLSAFSKLLFLYALPWIFLCCLDEFLGWDFFYRKMDCAFFEFEFPGQSTTIKSRHTKENHQLESTLF